MAARISQCGALGLFLSAALLVFSGCNPPAKQSTKSEPTEEIAKKTTDPKHDHSGWWCNEHGVPELECSMCSGKIASAFKKKGDWCEKHERAKSQCFICDPSLEAKFAVRFEAKYGKKPPIPEDNRAKPDEKK